MKAVRVGLAIGIAILLPLLSQMTVRIWSEPPDYSMYQETYPPQPKTKPERAKAEAEARKKRERYEKETAQFNLQVFYVSFPLGIAEILAAFLLRRRATVAAGLLFGGLSTVACGSYSSWETLPGSTRYASLIVVLVLLGILAYVMDRPPREDPAIE